MRVVTTTVGKDPTHRSRSFCRAGTPRRLYRSTPLLIILLMVNRKDQGSRSEPTVWCRRGWHFILLSLTFLSIKPFIFACKLSFDLLVALDGVLELIPGRCTPKRRCINT